MCNINHPKFPRKICAKKVYDKDKAVQCDLCDLWDSYYMDRNNRFLKARQNIWYYQIFTGHFKNPSDIMSACLGSQVQMPDLSTC